jgi:inorganic pyrophosphatase
MVTFWLKQNPSASRLIDGEEADDKIVAVLRNDVVYSHYNDITDCPDIVIQRLKHYFLTYNGTYF